MPKQASNESTSHFFKDPLAALICLSLLCDSFNVLNASFLRFSRLWSVIVTHLLLLLIFFNWVTSATHIIMSTHCLGSSSGVAASSRLSRPRWRCHHYSFGTAFSTALSSAGLGRALFIATFTASTGWFGSTWRLVGDRYLHLLR
jgi:hypothetical protein